MEPRVSIITLAVEDLERSASFYVAMGLKRHQGITEGVAFFQMGGAILSLFPRKDAEADSGELFSEGISRVYLAYNTRSESEVDIVISRAGKVGGRIVKAPSRAFWGGWYGYFADPDNNLWEVAHNPDFPIDTHGDIRLPDEP